MDQLVVPEKPTIRILAQKGQVARESLPNGWVGCSKTEWIKLQKPPKMLWQAPPRWGRNAGQSLQRFPEVVADDV